MHSGAALEAQLIGARLSSKSYRATGGDAHMLESWRVDRMWDCVLSREQFLLARLCVCVCVKKDFRASSTLSYQAEIQAVRRVFCCQRGEIFTLLNLRQRKGAVPLRHTSMFVDFIAFSLHLKRNKHNFILLLFQLQH